MASYYSFGNIGNNSPVTKKNWLKEFHTGGLQPYPVGTYDQKKTKKSWWLNGTFNGTEYQVNYKGNFKYKKNSGAAIGKWKIANVYSKNKLQLKIKVGPPFVKYNHKGYETNSLKDTFKLINKINANIFSKNDSFYGGTGNDVFWGYLGNDKIYGGSGNDILCGGIGNDKLIGGKGIDKLIGGKGKDIFKLSTGKGYDLIQDFKDKQDKIFIGSAKKLKLKNKGKDVYIYKGKDLLAKVKGAKGDLSKKGKYLV